MKWFVHISIEDGPGYFRAFDSEQEALDLIAGELVKHGMSPECFTLIEGRKVEFVATEIPRSFTVEAKG